MRCTVQCFVHTVPKFKNRKIIFFLCYFYKENMLLFIISVCHAPFGEKRGWRNGQGFGQYVPGFFIVTNIAMIVVSDFSFKRNL